MRRTPIKNKVLVQGRQFLRSRNCLPCTSTLFFIGVRLIFLVFCVVFFFCLVCLHPVSCAPMLPVSLPCVLCANVASVYPVSCVPMLPVSLPCVLCANVTSVYRVLCTTVASVSTLCLVHQCCQCLYPVSCVPMLPVSLPCVL
jgi:cellulose synthase/poly-beta-1,6-N-acetylglucosamine synthase-like glycosyltransferase